MADWVFSRAARFGRSDKNLVMMVIVVVVLVL